MKRSSELFDSIKAIPLTGKKRQVAKYILDNYIEASFLTAAELARRAHVSEPTVIRLAGDLGFNGYPELQDALQQEVQAQLTTVHRLRASHRYTKSRSLGVQSLVAELKNLEVLLHSLNVREFRKIIQRLVSADKVIIIGYKMSSILADYLRMGLKKSIDNIVAVTASTGLLQEELVYAGERSVVVGIAFPRYTREVVQDFRLAHEQGVLTVAITDSELSPLIEYANHFLLAPCKAISYVDAFAAAMGLLCAIATEVSLIMERDVMDRLARLELLWQANDVFF